MVRLQSDRVGRRPPGSRYEDRTFGRDADERESTAQRGPCPSISCTTPESVSPSITTASRRSATGTTSSGSTWAAVSNSFSPMPPAPPTSTMSARSERSPALSSAAAISSVPTIRMRGPGCRRLGRSMVLLAAAARLVRLTGRAAWRSMLPRGGSPVSRPSIGRIERLLAQEMASATVSLGGTGPAMIGPGTAGPLSSGGGEGWRPSDTLLRRVQDRPRTVFA